MPPLLLHLSGDRIIHLQQRWIRCGEQQIGRLTEQEARLLRHLVEAEGRVVDHDELNRSVWRRAPPVSAQDIQNQQRRIRKCVRLLREKIELDPSNPCYLLTIRGVGYRFDPTGGCLGGPPPSADTQRRLPEPKDIFLGRAAELSELSRRLEQGARCLLILGPGGVGKTRLALRAAAVLRGRYSGGAWFCPLRDCRSRHDVLAQLATSLELPALRGVREDDDARTLGDALGGRGPCLVILDNLEQLQEGALGDLSGWLAAATGLSVLLTSRFPEPQADHTLRLNPLPEHEGAALFTLRAGPSAGSPAEALTITRQLEGLPLAIELAARSAALSAPGALTARLAGGESAVARSLRAVVDWSWRLLPPPAQQALARCAIFRGPFDLEAFEQLVPEDSLAQLELLVERSLVRQIPARGLFELPVGVRQLAEARLRAGSPAPIEALHRDGYLRRAEALALGVTLGDPLALRTMSALTLELRAISERARDPETRARVALALAPLLKHRGPLRLAIHLLDAALELVQPPPRRAKLLVRRGMVRRLMGSPERAREDLEAALSLDASPAIGASARTNLGLLAWQSGDKTGAQSALEAALADAEATGDRSMSGRIHLNLMVLYKLLDQLGVSEHHLGLAMADAEAAGDRTCRRGALGNLALLRRRQGRLDEAEAAHRQELALQGAVDHRTEARTLSNYGALLLDRGRLNEAEPRLRQALALHRLLGNRAPEGVVSGNLGLLLLERGERVRALETLQAALGTHATLNSHHQAKALCDLALLHLVCGDRAAALGCLSQAGERAHSDLRAASYLAVISVAAGGSLTALEAAPMAADDAAGQALVGLLRAARDPALPPPAPPPSVYFRVLSRLLLGDR